MLRRIKATTASVLLHCAIVVWLLSFHAVPTAIRVGGPDAFERTPLVAPPLAREPLEPIVSPPPVAPVSESLVEPAPALPPPKPPPELAIAESSDLLQLSAPDPAPPPPSVQEEAEETVDLAAAEPRREIGQLAPRFGIEVPSSPLREAMRALASGNGPTRIVIGNASVGDSSGSVTEARSLPRSPANTGSEIELLNDPRGVDFEPYLVQVLASVRRNWAVLIPQSARMGQARR